jgi:hypothetical protein
MRGMYPALMTLFDLISLKHFLKSTSYRAPHFSDLFIVLLLPVSWVQQFSPVPCSEIMNIRVLPLGREAKLYTQISQKED